MQSSSVMTMSCMALVLLTSSSLYCVAQSIIGKLNQHSFVSANSTTAFEATNSWNSAGNGPFDLGIVYPLYVSSGVPQSNSVKLTCVERGFPYAHYNHYMFSGNNLPVHVIFYGNGITNTQQNILTNLIAKIGGHSYWDAVRHYSYYGHQAATPALGVVKSTGCITSPSSNYNIGGCNLLEGQGMNIVNYMIDMNGLPKQDWSVYTIILGTDVSYTAQTKANKSFKIGSSSLCGMHGIISWGSAKGGSYSLVGLPSSPSSSCNVAQALGGSFPNEYAVDNAAGILIHELIESILTPQMYADRSITPDGSSAWKGDVCNYEPTDICGNQFLNVGMYGNNNSNIQIGSYNYILYPMWDPLLSNCVMG